MHWLSPSSGEKCCSFHHNIWEDFLAHFHRILFLVTSARVFLEMPFYLWCISFSLKFFMPLILALCENSLVQTSFFFMEICFESNAEVGLELWDRWCSCQGCGLPIQRRCFINIMSVNALGGFSGVLIKLPGRWALPLPSIACQPLSAIVC